MWRIMIVTFHSHHIGTPKKKKNPNTSPDHLYRRTFLGAKIQSREENEGNKQSEGP